MRLVPLVALIALVSSAGGAGAKPPSFDVQKVADGVYAVVRRDPPALGFDANNAFIINAEDVIVVDANVSPSSTRDVVAALRKLTSKRVRYVISTHWHDDHIAGNEVWRAAYPGVEFIAQRTFTEDLETVGVANRKSTIAGVPEFVVQLKKLVATKTSLAGGELTAEERESDLYDIAWGERYVAEAPRFRIPTPTIVVGDRLTLVRGARTIDIRFLGRAHTRADLVVHLPNEGVVITGDIVVWPVPLIGTTSYPLEYGATLDSLIALKPRVIVPGHGPVFHDDAYLRLMSRLLASIKEQSSAAVARGETLEEARKRIDLNEFRAQFAGDSKERNILFSSYVVGPGIARAYEDAKNRR